MSELIQSSNIYKDIFESFLDLYIRCDLKGNVTMASPSSKDILDYDIEELLGNDVTNYYLYNSRTKLIYKTLLKEKHIKNFDINLIGKNGKIIPCICNVRLLKNNNGRSNEIEVICRDVSQLVQSNTDLKDALERAEYSSKVKDQFLANMSHEIRTPMNGVIGLIDLLVKTELNDKQLGYLKTMRHSSDILLNLMNNIISITKARSKKIKPNKDVINVSESIKNIISLFEMEGLKKNISIDIQIKNDVPDYIETDETRLSQILINLLSNAIKFSNKNGHVVLTINAIKKQADKILLKVDVIDNGIGIAPKYHSKLFQSFTQIEDSYSKKFSGSGLGLAITKELVLLLGGDIKATSQLGEGSTFSFTFKTKECSAPQKESLYKQSKLPANNSNSESKKILLVDDNKVNTIVAKEILLTNNHKVVTAADGFEAIRKAQETVFDIILMDIQLPELSGIDAMIKIKSIYQGSCPPIVVVTAFSSEIEKKEFLQKGFNAYLGKPYSAIDLLNIVNKFGNYNEDNIKTVISKTSELINIETLNQLIAFSDFNTVKHTLLEFNKEMMADLKKAKRFLKKESFEQLGWLLHNMKGNSGTLGAETLFERTRLTEQKVKKGNFESLDDDLKSLYLIFCDFRIEVEKLLNIKFDE